MSRGFAGRVAFEQPLPLGLKRRQSWENLWNALGLRSNFESSCRRPPKPEPEAEGVGNIFGLLQCRPRFGSAKCLGLSELATGSSDVFYN